MTHTPITITADSMHSAAALAEMADKLPEGIAIRFRADSSDETHPWCPFCGSDSDVRWVRNTVPEAWDRCACNDCGRSWDEESHVVEGWSKGERCDCGSEGIHLPDPDGVNTVRHCGAPACADHAVNVRIPEVLWDAESLRQTEASLMGRL